LVHGPLELTFVLLCVAEPLRIVLTTDDLEAKLVKRLKGDVRLLQGCVLGLFISASIEVFALL